MDPLMKALTASPRCVDVPARTLVTKMYGFGPRYSYHGRVRSRPPSPSSWSSTRHRAKSTSNRRWPSAVSSDSLNGWPVFGFGRSPIDRCMAMLLYSSDPRDGAAYQNMYDRTNHPNDIT